MTNMYAKSVAPKAAYRKPQAAELNTRTTASGTEGAFEAMMMSDNPVRKSNSGS